MKEMNYKKPQIYACLCPHQFRIYTQTCPRNKKVYVS